MYLEFGVKSPLKGGCMGLIDGLIGNASEVDTEALEEEVGTLLIDGEKISKGYKVIRDMFVFTDKRLILVDKQGLTGRKVEYHSIPYGDVSHFSVETTGNFDHDSEMKIWLRSGGVINKEFKRRTNILEIQRHLAENTLNK